VERQRRRWDRKFDWVEARARHAAGETMASIARALGVDRRGVARVIKMPEAYVQQGERSEFIADRIPCPRCHGPMMRHSELCAGCFRETREFAPTTLRERPAMRTELRNVELNRIIELDGGFGVVCRGSEKLPPHLRLVDFWDERGLTFVPARTIVRAEPTFDVLVGGVVEGGEEI